MTTAAISSSPAAAAAARVAPHRTLATAAVGKKQKKGMVDPRLDNLRTALYPRTRAERGEAPTGVHRPDAVAALERTLPGAGANTSANTSAGGEAHATIVRAFQLVARRRRTLRAAELRRKGACMRAAMAELETHHPAWYRAARARADPRAPAADDEAAFRRYRGAAREFVESRSIPGFFPRELRVPVDSPPRDGWQYEWAPPPRFKTKE